MFCETQLYNAFNTKTKLNLPIPFKQNKKNQNKTERAAHCSQAMLLTSATIVDLDLQLIIGSTKNYYYINAKISNWWNLEKCHHTGILQEVSHHPIYCSFLPTFLRDLKFCIVGVRKQIPRCCFRCLCV